MTHEQAKHYLYLSGLGLRLTKIQVLFSNFSTFHNFEAPCRIGHLYIQFENLLQICEYQGFIQSHSEARNLKISIFVHFFAL